MYADNAAMLTAVTTLPAGDGWGTCWAVTAEGITFGEELVIAGQTEPDCEHEDASPVDGKCDLCGEDVALPEGTYLINSATVATAGSLSALINADLDGTYYVTEDLTLGSEAGIGAFTGTLDGQGHSLKGIVINMNSNGGYESTVIASNSGTIENIAFAWYDFEKLYEEITGTNITVNFVSDLNSLPTVTGNYFILGDDLAAEAGKNTSGIATDNGHKIVKDGNALRNPFDLALGKAGACAIL